MRSCRRRSRDILRPLYQWVMKDSGRGCRVVVTVTTFQLYKDLGHYRVVLSTGVHDLRCSQQPQQKEGRAHTEP